MLTLIRLAAKYNFELTNEVKGFIGKESRLIEDCHPGKIKYHLRKLFLRGKAQNSFKKLLEYGLLNKMFPGIEDLRYSAWFLEELALTDSGILGQLSVDYILALFFSAMATTKLEQRVIGPGGTNTNIIPCLPAVWPRGSYALSFSNFM